MWSPGCSCRHDETGTIGFAKGRMPSGYRHGRRFRHLQDHSWCVIKGRGHLIAINPTLKLPKMSSSVHVLKSRQSGILLTVMLMLFRRGSRASACSSWEESLLH